jgi:hypothetical protein
VDSRKQTPHQNLQVCDGIVRSKLPLFDQTKRPARPRLPGDQKGFVQSRRAMFDQPAKPGRALFEATDRPGRAMFDQPALLPKAGRPVLGDQPGGSGLDEAAGRAGLEPPRPSRKHVGELLRQRELRGLVAGDKSSEASNTKKAD